MNGPQKSSHLLGCWVLYSTYVLYCTYNLLSFCSVQVIYQCRNAKVLNGDTETAASRMFLQPLVSLSTQACPASHSHQPLSVSAVRIKQPQHIPSLTQQNKTATTQAIGIQDKSGSKGPQYAEFHLLLRQRQL